MKTRREERRDPGQLVQMYSKKNSSSLGSIPTTSRSPCLVSTSSFRKLILQLSASVTLWYSKSQVSTFNSSMLLSPDCSMSVRKFEPVVILTSPSTRFSSWPKATLLEFLTFWINDMYRLASTLIMCGPPVSGSIK